MKVVLLVFFSHIMSSESIELQYNVDLTEYFSSGSKSKIAIIPHGNKGGNCGSQDNT